MSKRHEPDFAVHCYYCYGYGYVERINGGPRIKCIACDGSGRAEDWRAWQERDQAARATPPAKRAVKYAQDIPATA